MNLACKYGSDCYIEHPNVVEITQILKRKSIGSTCRYIDCDGEEFRPLSHS
jgi:hypothetical protein